MLQLLLIGLVRKICKRVAWAASWFFNPITVMHWTGILPFRVISFQEFDPLPFHTQAVLTGPKPRCIQGEGLLNSFPVTDRTISHLIEVNGGLATQGGYVFDDLGRLIREASHKYREQHRRALVSRPFSLFPTIKEFHCEVAVLTASNHQIYWHWLFEVLPRLGMIEKAGGKPERYYLQNSYRFQRESLEFLRVVSPESIIDSDQFPIISASKLLIPCHQIIGPYPTWACQFLRERFLPRVVTSYENTRIYISRKNAQHRRVINELEIIDLLKSYGIVSVELENLSFSEQVNLFNNAELVVGPHGGGLANLVFCSKGTQVIELFPKTTIDAFYALSRTLELEYYYLRARDGNSKNFDHDDYRIVLEDLVRTLEFAGDGKDKLNCISV